MAYMNANTQTVAALAGNQNALSGVRSQGIKLRELTDPRARQIAYYAQRIPRTPEGYLAAILRTDLIDPLREIDPKGLPEDAYVPLNYDEGFPALPDGRPVWFKMDHEPPEAFAAFEVYVDLVEQGPRHVAQLLENSELAALLGDGLTLDGMRNAYYMYFWKDRALAHDLFQNAAYRHIRVRRALSTEDKSYQLATKMLAKLETVFDKAEFWDQVAIDPGVALNYLEKLSRIQRISSGLPATAPAEEGGSGASTSFEMIMRKVTEDNTMVPNGGVSPSGGGVGTVLDERGRLITNTEQFMKGALRDPATSKMMQEVIIRMTQNAGATKTPRWASRVEDPEAAGAEGDEADALNQVPSEYQHLAEGRNNGTSSGSSEP